MLVLLGVGIEVPVWGPEVSGAGCLAYLVCILYFWEVG